MFSPCLVLFIFQYIMAFQKLVPCRGHCSEEQLRTTWSEDDYCQTILYPLFTLYNKLLNNVSSWAFFTVSSLCFMIFCFQKIMSQPLMHLARVRETPGKTWVQTHVHFSDSFASLFKVITQRGKSSKVNKGPSLSLVALGDEFHFSPQIWCPWS